MSPLIQEIANQASTQVGLEDQAAKLGFVDGAVLTPQGIITSMVGPEPLQKIGEDEEAPLRVVMQGYQKGYRMDTYALSYKCTKTFYEWLNKGAQIQGADASVNAELQKLKEQVQNLVFGSQLTRNIQMTKVFAEGFSGTTTGAAYGAGSILGDGKLLFATDHPVKAKPGVTFDNTIAGAIAAIGAGGYDVTANRAVIAAAIQKYKTGMYCMNGYRVKTPSVFQLLVPRALESAAREALNTAGSQAGVYSGVGTNANALNLFSFQGSAVEIVVLDMLGEYDENGAKIGGTNADKMWFLLNREEALKFKAFRIFTLWSNQIKMYQNDATDAFITKLTVHFGCDAFNAEYAMGYAGA